MNYELSLTSKKFISVFVLLIYLTFSTLILLSPFDSMNVNGMIGWGLLIVSVWTYYFISSEFISTYMLFLLLLFLFSFGQSLLMPFGLLSIERNLLSFKYVSAIQLLEAQKYTLVCLACFHLGALIQYNNKKITNGNFFSFSNKVVRYTSYIIVIITSPAYVYRIWGYMSKFGSSGYNSIYSDTSSSMNGIVIIVSNLFFAGSFLLLYSYREKKIARLNLYFFIVLSVLPFLFSGKRIDFMATILCLILFQNYFVKKINVKSSMKYIVIGIVLLLILGAISSLRTVGEYSLAEVINYIVTEGPKKNIFTDVIAELGGSMGPTIGIMQLISIGSFQYRYGNTFFFSLVSVIPSLGLWDTSFVDHQTSLANSLTEALGLNFGSGFSIVAESYLNFGIFGIVFFILFGFCLLKLFSLLSIESVKKSPLIGIFIIIFFRFITNVPRDSFLVIVRTLVYVLLPIFLLLIICKYGLKIVRGE